MKKSFVQEFILFLREYKVVPLAVAFIMGQAITSLVGSLVKDMLLPIVTPLISSESWSEAVLHIGSVTISYGSFLAELLNFLILAFLVFIVVKKIIKSDSEDKK